MTLSEAVFRRTRFSWLAYFMLAYFAYMLAAPGQFMPFLRAELGLNYTVTGLHFSAFAFGMVVMGLLSERIVQRWGRMLVFWGGGAGMALMGLLLTLGFTPWLTIPTAFLMGFLGNSLLIMVQSTLSDHHGMYRATALTEANVIASIGSSFAPLAVGGFQGSGIGWRGALFIGGAFWLLLYWRFRRVEIPPRSPEAAQKNQRPQPLPALFWRYWLVVFFVVSIEWSVIFWGADFLENNVGLPRTQAATLMSVFFVAIVIGRFIGSRLTLRFNSGNLLIGAILLTTGGFLVFWLSPLSLLNIAGLFITGLGVANLFPLTLAVASGLVTERQSDLASGKLTLGSGLAILCAPQVLGTLADQTNIETAYGIVVLLLFAALITALLSNRQARRLYKLQTAEAGA